MNAAESCKFEQSDDEGDQKKQALMPFVPNNDLVDFVIDDATICHTGSETRIALLDMSSTKQSVHTTTTTTTTTTSMPQHLSTTVYISGMPLRYCTETVIEKMMTRYGKIVRITVHTQFSNKIFAFCEFIDSSSAKEAINALNGRKLGGQSLLIRPAYQQSSSVLSSSSSPSMGTSSSEVLNNNPKRQRQQLDSKIEAIQRKLSKKIHD